MRILIKRFAMVFLSVSFAINGTWAVPMPLEANASRRQTSLCGSEALSLRPPNFPERTPRLGEWLLARRDFLVAACLALVNSEPAAAQEGNFRLENRDMSMRGAPNATAPLPFPERPLPPVLIPQRLKETIALADQRMRQFQEEHTEVVHHWLFWWRPVDIRVKRASTGKTYAEEAKQFELDLYAILVLPAIDDWRTHRIPLPFTPEEIDSHRAGRNFSPIWFLQVFLPRYYATYGYYFTYAYIHAAAADLPAVELRPMVRRERKSPRLDVLGPTPVHLDKVFFGASVVRTWNDFTAFVPVSSYMGTIPSGQVLISEPELKSVYLSDADWVKSWITNPSVDFNRAKVSKRLTPNPVGRATQEMVLGALGRARIGASISLSALNDFLSKIYAASDERHETIHVADLAGRLPPHPHSITYMEALGNAAQGTEGFGAAIVAGFQMQTVARFTSDDLQFQQHGRDVLFVVSRRFYWLWKDGAMRDRQDIRLPPVPHPETITQFPDLPQDVQLALLDQLNRLDDSDWNSLNRRVWADLQEQDPAQNPYLQGLDQTLFDYPEPWFSQRRTRFLEFGIDALIGTATALFVLVSVLSKMFSQRSTRRDMMKVLIAAAGSRFLLQGA